jgi:hypothetical protein
LWTTHAERPRFPRRSRRYRPVVDLHSAEGYLPSDPAGFLKDAFLGWSVSGREEDVETVADPVDAATLLSAEHHWKGRTDRGRDFTRPYGDRAWRAVDLLGQDDAGFCLVRRNEPSPLDGKGDFAARRSFTSTWSVRTSRTGSSTTGARSPCSDRCRRTGSDPWRSSARPEVELKNEVPWSSGRRFRASSYADEEAATGGAVGTRGFGDSFDAMKTLLPAAARMAPEAFPGGP